MNETELIKKIESEFGIKAEKQRDRRIWVTVKRKRLMKLCRFLYEENFEHLSAISVTDFPEERVYELTYHLWSYRDKILITVKTKIPRNKPEIESVTPIWGESAQIHERELHG